MLSRELSIFLTSLTLLFAASASAAPAKILPLGDSITSDGDFAYRDELYKMLDDAGYDFEFVGSKSENGSVNEPINHDGHSGWRADEINDDLQGWLSTYDVDIALVHLGTNDIIAGQADNTTLIDLESIVDKLQTKNTEIHTFVAKIIPLFYNTTPLAGPDQSTGLNSLLTSSWGNDHSTATSPVIIVDQHAVIVPTLDLKNELQGYIHPTDGANGGEGKMAQEWFEALKGAAILPPILLLTPSTATTGGATVTVTSTSQSAGAINFSTNSIGICAVNTATGAVTPQAAGTCEIVAVQDADASYAAATSEPLSITVTATAQVVTFAATTPAIKTYGDEPFTVTASSNSNSGFPVTISSTTTAVCTINSSNKVTIIKSGVCSLEATQMGGIVGAASNAIIYAEATSVVSNITIIKAEQAITITAAPPINKTFGDAPFSVTAISYNTKTPPVATSLVVSVGTTTANVCTYDSTTQKITIESAGLCTIKAVQQGNDQYKEKTETFDVSISAKGQTITFPAISDKTINTAPFTISATASSNLPVSFSSTTTNVCTVANKKVTLIAVGTCRITATAGNSNNTTASATQEFEVTKVKQIVSFASNTPTEKTNKDAPFNVSASSTSGLETSILSTTNNVCTIDANNKVTIISVGSCVLKAQQAGDATYQTANATHMIVISVANTAYDTVVKIINSNGNTVTTVPLLKNIGLKNLNPNFDYTKALKKGSYKNKSRTDVIKEMQKMIDLENKENLETAGSPSVAWLLLFGIIALHRRNRSLKII